VSVVYKDKLKQMILDNVNSHSGVAEKLELKIHLCGPLYLCEFFYLHGPLYLLISLWLCHMGPFHPCEPLLPSGGFMMV